jgi:hypothetical protein
MQKSSLTKYLLAACVAFSLTLTSAVFGQGVTTSGITGLVTDKNGAALIGATVSAVHEPSGTRAATVTGSGGRYSLTGLRVGGPYTVTFTSRDNETTTQKDVYLGLDHPQTVDASLATQIVVLEAYTVKASKDVTFDSNKMGAGATFTKDQIGQVPMIRRDVQDVVNMDTRASLTINTSTGEFSVSAMGQNSRYNSFLVDGQQSNDPFGLNANGFSSLRSPVPVEALAAMSVDISPYDVTHTGFTGALINAVTKSGTNEFHGSIYTYYTGRNLRAKNPGQGAADPNKGTLTPLQEHTYGLTFGGPIIKDKLFFFFAYDSFKASRLPYSPITFQPNAADVATIQAAAKTFGINAGDLSGNVVPSKQKTYLAKIDWNINDNQRATLTYRRTDSAAPNFSNGSTFTQFTSNAYQSNRITDNLSLLLNSTWTPELRTETGLAAIKYNGTASPYGPIAPEIYVNGVVGTNLNTGATVANGQLDLGTNGSYQHNALTTKDYNGHIYADYTWNSHEFKFGGDFDKSIYRDLFAQYFAGRYAFASPAAFAAGTPNYIRYQQPIPGYTVNDADYYYSYIDSGLIVQDTWKPMAGLTILAGLRYDVASYPTKPIFLPAFQTAFGIPNNSTGDGNYTVAPRFGFNYQLPTKWKIQMRGGLGLFQGSNPAVWVGNSYGTTGLINSVIIGSSTTSTTNPPLGAPYTPFHPDPNYVQTLPPPGIPTPNIALTDPKFKTPTSWKGNLAFDTTLPWYNLVATVEANFVEVYKGLYYHNLNFLPNATTPFNPDGRARYSGTTGMFSNFSNSVLELSNTDKGGSQAYTFQLTKPMKDNWAFAFAYTHTHATEVQPLTSSVASSNFNNRATINPNDNVAVRSNYVIPEKYVASLTYQFHFFKAEHTSTRLTTVFRDQTGHPYSWVFFGDANNDGTSGNDSFYMPAGTSDPKVVWSTSGSDPTGSIQAQAFWDFVKGTDLKKYQGQIVPANRSNNSVQKTIDLHLEQEIPLDFHNSRLLLFVDCLNFANIIKKSWGVTTGQDFGNGYSGYSRPVASATVNASGQYVYTFSSSTLGSQQVFTDLSRWQLQLGARLEF